MRRRVLLGSSLTLLLGIVGCDQRMTEPTSAGVTGTAPTTASVILGDVARLPAADAPRPAALQVPGGRISDAGLIQVADGELINPGDYQCPASTPIFDVANNAINEFFFEEFDLFILLYAQLWADLIPQYEALLFLQQTKGQEYGYDGEFTNQIRRTATDLRRFWDIDTSDLQVVPMKGSMLYDADRVARTYESPLVPPFGGLSEADAYFVAGLIRDALDSSNLLNGGNHPLFSFNAFAFSGDPGLGIPPKIVMGDAIMNGYASVGFGDVAPQAILAHEWGHQVQYAKDYFSDAIPTLAPPATAAEATRYTELMSDAQAAYYLTHARGGTMNRKRVEQFLEVFYQIGDCYFSDPSHHGTPNQRMAAARFGFDMADQAQMQGHIMTADEFHDAFVANYLSFIAPDA